MLLYAREILSTVCMLFTALQQHHFAFVHSILLSLSCFGAILVRLPLFLRSSRVVRGTDDI